MSASDEIAQPGPLLLDQMSMLEKPADVSTTTLCARTWRNGRRAIRQIDQTTDDYVRPRRPMGDRIAAWAAADLAESALDRRRRTSALARSLMPRTCWLCTLCRAPHRPAGR